MVPFATGCGRSLVKASWPAAFPSDARPVAVQTSSGSFGRPRPRPRAPTAGTGAMWCLPSTSMFGRIRSSHFGIHQLRSPSSSIVAGTSTMRTMVASISTAIARPRPNSLSWRSSPRAKAANTQNMISAAAVMTRAVAARPSATAVALSLRAVVLLLDAREEEHLVVHRQAEHDGEQEHRHPRLDRPGLVDADQLHAPAPLEDGDEDAVGGADRQQVHDHRLERHEHAAEHGHQQQEAEQQHDADQQRHAAGRGSRRSRSSRR